MCSVAIRSAITRMNSKSLAILWFLLVCVSFASGQVHHIPTVSLDKPQDLLCPLKSQVDSVRAEISVNVSEILFEIAANKTESYSISACGGGGWKRVVLLNMSDPVQNCPSQWRLYQHDTTGIRACGRLESRTSSCDSVPFSTNGHRYREVCGRITGYQFASPDGLYLPQYLSNINNPYVDGVSITHGTSRQHIWTLYAGVREYGLGCCTVSTTPDFVGRNYFCDTGNPQNEAWSGRLFTDHPLWDGVAGCLNNPASCCAPHTGPWFYSRQVAQGHQPLVNDIEVRICGGEATSNEDTPLELVEIFVRK